MTREALEAELEVSLARACVPVGAVVAAELRRELGHFLDARDRLQCLPIGDQYWTALDTYFRASEALLDRLHAAGLTPLGRAEVEAGRN
ncbi:MAG: hypothetical protein HS116_05190 [Planctomycetes bacterium]|nr:hypothetical protein [Planctomycetota bacterium]